MQHHHEDVNATLDATLLPITLSPGLGCLLGTCRIQIWSKLRNWLRTIATLAIVGQKWVIMCPHVVQARITITVCTSNIWTWIHKRQQYWVETALLVDRCLAAIAWAFCCLFSVEQCLAAFAWASCCHTCTSMDEHAVSESAYARINPYSYLTASAYARVFGMCELLTVLKWRTVPMFKLNKGFF